MKKRITIYLIVIITLINLSSLGTIVYLKWTAKNDVSVSFLPGNRFELIKEELKLTPQQMQERFIKQITEVNKIIRSIAPDEYKEIFIMREYNGFKYSDIADITKQSINTVKVKIFRARERIRQILQPYLSEMSK